LILEKLAGKALQYRENYTLVLMRWQTKLQYFKDDLTTPKDKPLKSEGESLVIRRSLPDKSSESGLFVIRKLKEDAEDEKRKDQSLKEAKPYPFVSELDFLLTEEQANHRFSYGGQEEVQGRKVHVVNFIPGKYEASKFYKENGQRRFSAASRKGRILVETESYDVLQIDWTLIENDQLHLGFGVERKKIFFITRPNFDLKWERWDTTLKYKEYHLPNSEQQVWLLASSETFWAVRSARKPVYRLNTTFEYKRFNTDIKVLDADDR